MEVAMVAVVVATRGETTRMPPTHVVLDRFDMNWQKVKEWVSQAVLPMTCCVLLLLLLLLLLLRPTPPWEQSMEGRQSVEGSRRSTTIFILKCVLSGALLFIVLDISCVLVESAPSNTMVICLFV